MYQLIFLVILIILLLVFIKKKENLVIFKPPNSEEKIIEISPKERKKVRMILNQIEKFIIKYLKIYDLSKISFILKKTEILLIEELSKKKKNIMEGVKKINYQKFTEIVKINEFGGIMKKMDIDLKKLNDYKVSEINYIVNQIKDLILIQSFDKSDDKKILREMDNKLFTEYVKNERDRNGNVIKLEIDLIKIKELDITEIQFIIYRIQQIIIDKIVKIENIDIIEIVGKIEEIIFEEIVKKKNGGTVIQNIKLGIIEFKQLWNLFTKKYKIENLILNALFITEYENYYDNKSNNESRVVIKTEFNMKENDKIRNQNIKILIKKISEILSENIENLSTRERNYIITKIQNLIYKEINRNTKKGTQEINDNIEFILSEYIENKKPKERKIFLKDIEDLIFNSLLQIQIEYLVYQEILIDKKKSKFEVLLKEINKKIELKFSVYLQDKKPKEKKNLLKNIEEIILSYLLRIEMEKDYEDSSNKSIILRDTKYDKNTGKFSIIKKEISEENYNKEVNRDFNYEINLYYKTPFQFLDYQDMLISDEYLDLQPSPGYSELPE